MEKELNLAQWLSQVVIYILYKFLTYNAIVRAHSVTESCLPFPINNIIAIIYLKNKIL